MRLLCMAVLTLFMTGCMQAGVFTLNSGTWFSDQEKISDVAYGQDPWQQLDIYLPSAKAVKRDGTLPVIVFFYGGSWQMGDKAYYPFAAKPFTDQGYIVVIPNYAKYPPNRFPSFIEDGAKALHGL